MIIHRKSGFTGNLNSMDIDVTKEQLQAWIDGQLIQDAMPDLTADEREFIMTGVTPEEWNKVFGKCDQN